MNLRDKWLRAYSAARSSTLTQAEEWRMDADYDPWSYLCTLGLRVAASRQFDPPRSSMPLLLRIDPRWRAQHKRFAFNRLHGRWAVEPRPIP